MELYEYQKALRSLQMQIVKIQSQVDALRCISADKELRDVFKNELDYLEGFEISLLQFYTRIRKLHGDVGDCLDHMSEYNRKRLRRLMKLD